MKKVLLHICCGPCAIYPFEDLTKSGYEVEGFFYNSNIQPQSEYLKRKAAVEQFKKEFNVQVHFSDNKEKDYLDCVKSARDKDSRCESCFDLRLKNTHSFALVNKFDFFTTTLLVSPYQDQQVIKSIGSRISKNSNTQFLFCDFRPGFKYAHTKAKELNLYCQKYCGCLASLEERSKDKKAMSAKC